MKRLLQNNGYRHKYNRQGRSKTLFPAIKRNISAPSSRDSSSYSANNSAVYGSKMITPKV